MSTPLPDVYRKHLIEIFSYPAGTTLRLIINDKIADETTTHEIAGVPAAVYMILEFGKPAHSKNRGVLIDCQPGDTFYIIDRDNPNEVLHSGTYQYAGLDQFFKL